MEMYPHRRSPRDQYLDALTTAHKWLMIASDRAVALSREEDVDDIGHALGHVYRAQERTLARKGPHLRTQTDQTGLALDRLRQRAIERERRRFGSQERGPARPDPDEK